MIAFRERGWFTAAGQSYLNIIILLWQEMRHMEPRTPASVAAVMHLSHHDDFLFLFNSVSLKCKFHPVAG